MMVQLSIFDTVGAALRLVRGQVRPIAIIAAIGAAAVTLVSMIGAAVGGVAAGLVSFALSTIISATLYAALIGLVLRSEPERRLRLRDDARVVWSAMMVVGFFLGIVVVLYAMVSTIIATPAVAPFMQAITAAGEDRAALMVIAQRFADANPGLILFLFLLGALIWMFLTSRLYLAAPASLDARRVLTFETWSWTKNNMLRIVGARLLLLMPAYVLMSALTTLLGRAVGIDMTQMSAAADLAQRGLGVFALFSLISTFISTFAYSSFEAALSTYLYLALKPRTAIPPA